MEVDRVRHSSGESENKSDSGFSSDHENKAPDVRNYDDLMVKNSRFYRNSKMDQGKDTLNPDKFTVWTPEMRIRDRFDEKMSCKGCETQLSVHTNKFTGTVKYSPEFYVHCIKGCKKYKELNLTTHCFSCRTSFLDEEAFMSHYGTHHKHDRPPKWLVETVFVGASDSELATHAFKCRGCGKIFDLETTAPNLIPEEEYSYHCLKNCREYKRLNRNMPRTCSTCHQEFGTPLSSLVHYYKAGHA